MGLFRKTEDRALHAAEVTPGLQPYWSSQPLDVTTSNALKVSDAYACVRVLADSVSSLPLHVYRHTPAGRVPAGADSRAVQLLQRPSPGSTTVDLISQVMVHLNVYGEAFIGQVQVRPGDGAARAAQPRERPSRASRPADHVHARHDPRPHGARRRGGLPYQRDEYRRATRPVSRGSAVCRSACPQASKRQRKRLRTTGRAPAAS